MILIEYQRKNPDPLQKLIDFSLIFPCKYYQNSFRTKLFEIFYKQTNRQTADMTYTQYVCIESRRYIITSSRRVASYIVQVMDEKRNKRKPLSTPLVISRPIKRRKIKT